MSSSCPPHDHLLHHTIPYPTRHTLRTTPHHTTPHHTIPYEPRHTTPGHACYYAACIITATLVPCHFNTVSAFIALATTIQLHPNTLQPYHHHDTRRFQLRSSMHTARIRSLSRLLSLLVHESCNTHNLSTRYSQLFTTHATPITWLQHSSIYINNTSTQHIYTTQTTTIPHRTANINLSHTNCATFNTYHDTNSTIPLYDISSLTSHEHSSILPSHACSYLFTLYERAQLFDLRRLSSPSRSHLSWLRQLITPFTPSIHAHKS